LLGIAACNEVLFIRGFVSVRFEREFERESERESLCGIRSETAIRVPRAPPPRAAHGPSVPSKSRA